MGLKTKAKLLTSMEGNKELQKLLEEFNKPEVEEPSTIDTSSGLA